VNSTGHFAGGLTGRSNETISNSYATGNVNSTGHFAGGLAGIAYKTISNSYATGNVSGQDSVGGLSGYAGYNISNCYASGSISGNNYVGGLTGCANDAITNSASFAKEVSGVSKIGSLVGEIVDNSITITECSCVDISGISKTGNGTDEQNNGITYLNFDTQIQVGIYGDENSHIKFDTSFSYDLSAILSDIASDNSFSAIQEFMNILNTKATSLGSITNRLDSAIDSITTNYENLVSSRSTLRDTDVAKESSEYIKQQILQQASATLLSTANQSPSIALQLI